ncbi:MAG: tripartite tricarboxylate transporter substrate binding protein [Burkholderiales bacterium]|nr:tripartite tricarboxylate transporter substrate binding protein [Burkholderiales bacterium]
MHTVAKGLLRIAGVIALLAAPGLGAAWPEKPVRVVVPFAAGGPADLVARLLAQKLSEQWRQPVVVDNRGGAGGNIGTALVGQALPDGYTLLLTTSVFVSNPSLYRNAGYDAFKEFAPIILTSVSATVVSRHPSYTAVNSMQDIVQQARSAPLPYASPGIGTAGHLAAELFRTITQANLQQVPYKGAGPAMTALLGGEVRLGFTAVPPVVALSRSGKLVPIAVTSMKRLDVLPHVPAVAETYPGFEVDNMYGLLAPKATPLALVRKINADTLAALKSPDVRQRFAQEAFEIRGNTPEEFAQYLRAEFTKWAKVVRDSGARVD